MSILNELWAERLNEKKVQDDEYFIVVPDDRGNWSKIDLYTEKAFKSREAAEAFIEKQRLYITNSPDVDTDSGDAALDDLQNAEIMAGKSLKREYPKLFEAKLGPGWKKVDGSGDSTTYKRNDGAQIKISKPFDAYTQSHGPAVKEKYVNVSYKKSADDDWSKWGEVKTYQVGPNLVQRVLKESAEDLAEQFLGEGKISNFKPPFSVNGNWVDDSKGRSVCEMGESREALKEIAAALNAWVKMNEETTEGLFVSKFKEGKLFEAKIPAWFKNGAKVRLTPEYADKDPNEVFTLKNVDEETGKGRIEDEDGRGWNIRASQVESARGKKTVYEDAKLNALGAGLAGKKTAAKKPEGDEIPDEEEASTKPKSTVPPEDDAAPAEDDAPDDASAEEPKDDAPAEKPEAEEKPEKVEPKASELPDADAEENTSAPEFKVGDVVKPLIGPHKGEPHDVVGVNPDGTLNIKPKGLEASAVKYPSGHGGRAKPDQVVIAESKTAENTITYERVFNVLKNGEHQVVVWELHNGKRIVVAEILECKDKKKLEKMTKHYDTKKVVETLKPLKAGSLLAQIDEHLMPLSYRPKKGDTLEAYGRKGMKNTQWRKFFRNDAHLEKWCEENDATVEGMRELDRSERAQ